MNIFWLLFLAHLMADFPLQINTIYSLKKRNAVGVLPHVAIYTTINVIVLLPFLNSGNTWFAIIALAITFARIIVSIVAGLLIRRWW